MPGNLFCDHFNGNNWEDGGLSDKEKNCHSSDLFLSLPRTFGGFF